MIRFTNIKVRNFMSVGNKWMGYDFAEGQSYLVTGKNGVGKSIILLDGLMFALFNKAFRNINLGQLVNSINNKECQAEVEFEIGKTTYKIERGIKPTYLNIYINGKLKTKDGDLPSYQKFLESQILRMNEKTFKQIVVLGSKEYTPFMKLFKADRRIVVEDLLSLTIFQQMATVVQARQKSLMQESQTLATELRFVQKSIDETKDFINTLRSSGDEYVSNKQKDIEKHRLKMDELKDRVAEKEELVEKERKGEDLDALFDSVQESKMKLLEMSSVVESSIKRINDELNFFAKNDVCPKCHQDISQEFKDHLKCENDDKLRDFHKCIETSKTHTIKLNDDIDQIQARMGTIRDALDQVRTLYAEIRSHENIINVLNTDIKTHSSHSDSDLATFERKLADLNDDMTAKRQRDMEIVVEGRRLNYIYDMVRDGGIRSKIIDQYLPVINKLIRKYLEIMESDIDFSFDSDFKESIKSRHRDAFTYASFSEGQKLRIDLCLLFTWREISRMRNSSATNLIVFDEIGDSSLDAEGFECFMRILKEESEKQCVIIISHTPEKIAGKVDRIYEYDLHRGFTNLKKLTNNANEVSLT
jgi:DNA repair exonuclease SbcCD ATPase subunit